MFFDTNNPEAFLAKLAEPPPQKVEVVIMDIDGTLANAEHRMHLLPANRCIQRDTAEGRLRTDEAWREFLAAAVNDVPNREIVTLNNAMAQHALIFVVTGRGEEDREVTQRWLAAAGVEYDRLYMRPAGDRRQDCAVKKEILDTIRGEGFEVIMAVEDRKRVVAMWRANGVRCLQVCEGDY